MCDHTDFIPNGFRIPPDSLRFILRIQTFLKPLVVSRNTSRTGILIALKGLDAAEGKHKSAGRSDEISAGAQRPRNFRRVNQFPLAISLIRSFKPYSRNLFATAGKLSDKGKPM